jgi:hypothetical protein
MNFSGTPDDGEMVFFGISLILTAILYKIIYKEE